MRLVNADAPNHKFATSAGPVESDAAGCLEVRDEAFAAALLKSGWKEWDQSKKSEPVAKAQVQKPQVQNQHPNDHKPSPAVMAPPAASAEQTLAVPKGDKPKWMRSGK